MTPEQAHETAAHLAAVLAAIDAGELTATATCRARIEGAVTALHCIDSE